jgi:uncharacterized membrane protein
MKIPMVTARKKILLSVGAFLGVLATISIGYLFWPTLIYNQWIWKYYWGPVVADATGHAASYHGVVAVEGYTLISEFTYGVVLICALYGIYKLLKKLEIQIDWSFCLALIPYILFGPVTRVLEDTNYFEAPVVYWFISPLIYFQTAFYVILFLLLGYYLQKKTFSPRKKFILLLFVFLLIDIAYTILWFSGVSYGRSLIEPWFLYGLSVVGFLPILYCFIKRQTITINIVVFSGGLLLVLPCFFLIGRWISGDQWNSSYGTFVNVLVLVMGLVGLVTGLVYLTAYHYRKNESLAVYTKPLNLSMLAGHLIDGLTSYISIYDPFLMGLPSYIEKHPASNSLMELWPPLFPVVKFLLIILVIYVFDVLYKKELVKYQRLVNLLKIGIFILGVSPGLRDLLRVTMGV